MGKEFVKRIPTELEIKILQHIADEEEGDHSRWPTLVNCALVCKAWTNHARRHLYYAINMNVSKGALKFGCLCQYAHLRPFVRDFKWPRTEVQRRYCFDASDAHIIKDVAPAVMKLRFRRVNYCSLEPSLREAISTFTNIIELDITGSIFEDWTTVVRVISRFPLHAKLAMPRTVTFQDDSTEAFFPPPSRLVHIKLAFGCEAETVSWIRKGTPIPNIQTVEVVSKVDSNVLAKLLRSLAGSLQHLIIHIDSALGGNISDAPASCYRLTENTALDSIKVICLWTSRNRDMYESVITNLIGSICSPHLRSICIILACLAEEVEHFPWAVVNNLIKESPHSMQRVEAALDLSVETNNEWGALTSLSPGEYEDYFRQIRLALPELDKKVIMGIVSRAEISDAVPPGLWEDSVDYDYEPRGNHSPESSDNDEDIYEYDLDGYLVYS